MPQLSPASWILVVVVGLFTAIAAIWDYRQHRIPNNLTLPVFFAGWVYQVAFHGWSGIFSHSSIAVSCSAIIVNVISSYPMRRPGRVIPGFIGCEMSPGRFNRSCRKERYF